MIKVDEIKQFVDFLLNKDQSGHSYTPDQFNMLLRRAVDAQFKKEYGLPEDYKPGYPLPNIAWELTQKIMDDLSPLKTIITSTIDDLGQMKLPVDYVHSSRLGFKVVENNTTNTGVNINYVAVEVVSDNEWYERLGAAIKTPSKKFPVANICNGYIQFAPTNLATVEWAYLRYPKEPKWAYTIVNDTEVYDPINSVDIELPEIQTNNIAEIVLSYIGINLRETDLYQYAQSKTVNGI